MLSYRHAFHAGNHADVFKHAVLTLVLASLRQKDKPFTYLDTHAGGGLYDLFGEQAQKTSESRDAIGRLWAQRSRWPELQDYFSAIAAHNPEEELRHYPGSPEIARQLSRPQDKLTLLELHPRESEILRGNLGFDRRVSIHHRDAFEGLNALLPPTPRRGVVLIDPPYEQRSEYPQVASSLQKAWQRWPTGIYVVWYPLLPRGRDQSELLLRQMQAGGYASLLMAELEVDGQNPDFGMHGSGLAIVNPPWQLDQQLEQLLPMLAEALQVGNACDWRMKWLVK